MGFGPSFKFKTKVPAFENIELYNVMCGELILFVCFLLYWQHSTSNFTPQNIEVSLFKNIWYHQNISYHKVSFWNFIAETLKYYLSISYHSVEIVLFPDLLGLTPAPNNGTHGSLNAILRKPSYTPVMPEEVAAPSPLDPASAAIYDLGCSCDDEVSQNGKCVSIYSKNTTLEHALVEDVSKSKNYHPHSLLWPVLYIL